MKYNYHWNEETVQHFKERHYLPDFSQQIWEFVKQDCTLEKGETYEILANDLINKVFNKK